MFNGVTAVTQMSSVEVPQRRSESTQVYRWSYLLQVLLESYSILFSHAVPNCPLKDDRLSLHTVILVPPTSYAGPITAQAAANRFRTCSKEREERARGLVFEDAIPDV